MYFTLNGTFYSGKAHDVEQPEGEHPRAIVGTEGRWAVGLRRVQVWETRSGPPRLVTAVGLRLVADTVGSAIEL